LAVAVGSNRAVNVSNACASKIYSGLASPNFKIALIRVAVAISIAFISRGLVHKWGFRVWSSTEKAVLLSSKVVPEESCSISLEGVEGKLTSLTLGTTVDKDSLSHVVESGTSSRGEL